VRVSARFGKQSPNASESARRLIKNSD